MSTAILDHLGKGKLRQAKTNDDFSLAVRFNTVSRAELTDEYQMGPLPAGYEIMLLQLNPRTASGIAVSKLRREVIYWADRGR